MKTSELTMNDWVLYDGIAYQVSAIIGDIVTLVTENKKHFDVIVGKLEPIPLDDEIFETIGFTKKGAFWGIYDDYFDFQLHEINDGLWLANHHVTEVNIPDEQIYCNHVHELQHIITHCCIEKTIEL